MAALFSPAMNFHLLGAASLLAVWVLCRGRPRSRLFVQVVEGAGLMGSSIGYSLMGSHLPVLVLRPDLIVVLAMTFGMVVRAVFVPSPAARTAVLTALVGLPVVVGNHLGVQRESFAVLQQFVPASPVARGDGRVGGLVDR